MALCSNKNRRGFTLVEMLVSMTIFMTFVGILISSYSSIIKAQKEANDYRAMYTEARAVFDTLIGELREGMVDYGNSEYGNACNSFITTMTENLLLVSKDETKKKIWLDKTDPAHSILKIETAGGQTKSLNSGDVSVTDFEFKIYPLADPYSPQNVDKNQYQFHPFVTIFVSFEKEKVTGEPYKVDFQTTVSSRIYNQVYETPECP
ncbi:prepilin-type N-terminal cleavage/methylation domain-containing protein [Candidatus Peregrinibacteria bacterium]|nr:prepilin-type N-terminal cleavage/methylation domain-containing protein [Candidatus Peregrinibacteria bacterium]